MKKFARTTRARRLGRLRALAFAALCLPPLGLGCGTVESGGSALELSSVEPNTANNIAPTQITIHGEGFYLNYKITVDDNTPPLAESTFHAFVGDFPLTQVAWASPTTLRAVVPARLPKGIYELRVVDRIGGVSALPSAFSVHGDYDAGKEASWYQDFDGDGFGDPDVSIRSVDPPPGYVPHPTDCDDRSKFCHSNCDDNPLTEFVGADCYAPEFDLIVDGTTRKLAAALEAADATPGRDRIHIVANVTASNLTIGSGTGPGVELSATPGAVITVPDGATFGIDVADPGSVLRHLRFSGGKTQLELSGDGTRISQCRFTAFSVSAIAVDGGNIQVVDNILQGGVGGADTAAVVIHSPNTVLADNIIAKNASAAAIRLEGDATDVFIDHNTLAENGNGLIANTSDGAVCIRNNIFYRNAQSAVDVQKPLQLNARLACTAPLRGGPAYGNAEFESGKAACSGTDCDDCSCLNAMGIFFDHRTVDPAFDSNYCLGGEENPLIDAALDLGPYDLNGEGAGKYSGAAPELGAREDGAEDCW